MLGHDPQSWMSALIGDPEIVDLFSAKAELARYLKVEAAWTRALGKVTHLPEAEDIARAIETATIASAALNDGFAKDGLAIPALVKSLRSQVEPDAASGIHTGLTSQDVIDTSLVLALIQVLDILTARLRALDDSLACLNDTFGAAPTMAYTRMQPALETNVSEVIGLWQQPIPTLLRDLKAIAHDIRVIQWGGPIGQRDHPAADQLGAEFARQLGLNDPGHAWHTDRTLIVKTTDILSRMSTMTGKIGDDIGLMAALGSDQITLVGGGSSAMPHKNNPIMAETLSSLATYTKTMGQTMSASAQHEGFRSGKAMMLEWMVLPQICVSAGASLTLAARVIASIETLGASK